MNTVYFDMPTLAKVMESPKGGITPSLSLLVFYRFGSASPPGDIPQINPLCFQCFYPNYKFKGSTSMVKLTDVGQICFRC